MIHDTTQPVQAEQVTAGGISLAQGGGSVLERLSSLEDEELTDLAEQPHASAVLLCYLGFTLLFTVILRLLAPAAALLGAVMCWRRKSVSHLIDGC